MDAATRQVRQYGTWPSPLTPKLLSASASLREVGWDRDGTTLVWLEGRGGRNGLVMRRADAAPRDLTDDLTVRARVNAGGGDFTVGDNTVFFAGPGGRLYRQSLAGGLPRPITPGFGSAASPTLSPDGRWLLYVHSYENTDGLLLVDAAGADFPRKFAFGSDFVMQPAWHPQMTHAAYITWDFPLMPWVGTTLWLAALRTDPDGWPLPDSTVTLTGDADTAIFQPEFSPDGRYLSYISDADGWSHLYLYDLQTDATRQLTDGEHVYGAPAWGQGMRTYGWSHDSTAIYALRNQSGLIRLERIRVSDGAVTPVDDLADYTHLSQIAVAPTRDAVAVIASNSVTPPRIVIYEPDSTVPPTLDADQPGMMVPVDVGAGVRIVRRSGTENLGAAQLATVEPLDWSEPDGTTVYGLYHPPSSDRYTGDGLPPLIVSVHGGPTGQEYADYDPPTQFLTTRGFAVLRVNYRGSTGYGRAYMNHHAGGWGVSDVQDSISGAQHLVHLGRVDPNKLVIMGGSAGGFTVLRALIEKPGFFRAGISRYGVSNLFTLADTTWKFEARYNDWLLGPLPDAAAVWRERSPLFQADRIKDPLLIFHGDADEVVPKAQSDDLVAVLRRRGVPHEYHVFAGEGHGWRKPETIEAYYNAIIAFLKQYVVYA